MNSDRELTPWFVNGERPARKGVYEVNSYCGVNCYSFWDGARWRWITERPIDAFRFRKMETGRAFADVRWRGLTTNPQKAQP